MLNTFKFNWRGSAFALAVAVAAAAPAGTTAASDLDYSQTVGADQGHFVRIGLNKSVVIRLPAEAKDVIVGNPEIVDAVVRTKNTAYLFARKAGQTNIFFFDASGQQIMNVDLEVAIDSMAVQKLIDRAIPGNHITVDSADGSVVLGGTAANAVQAKLATDLASKFAGNDANVVNGMSISEGDQVMLKVRVVEVQRDVLKELGINLQQLALQAGNLALKVQSINPIEVSQTPNYGLGTVGFHSGSFVLNASIQAMEHDGVLRTLAEPTLTAISGQVANFHAGGEFPYVTQSCTAQNGCQNTVTYKNFGVELGFTPEVLSSGRISLKINTSVSELSDIAYGALNTRSADTTVELPSGGSMMMAGLIKNTSQQDIRGTPGLKNLPVLGALFRSRSFQSSQSELVVIVTPYIVNPVNEKQLATPADRLNPATDRQAILFGRLNQLYGAPGRKPGGVYHGTIGYIYE